jgi:hypothetical protein
MILEDNAYPLLGGDDGDDGDDDGDDDGEEREKRKETKQPTTTLSISREPTLTNSIQLQKDWYVKPDDVRLPSRMPAFRPTICTITSNRPIKKAFRYHTSAPFAIMQ